MGCQCSQPNKDKQVLIEQNKQIVPEEDSNSKSNMNINPQIDNNEKEKEKKEETPQVLSSIPEPPKEEKKEEPTTPKEQESCASSARLTNTCAIRESRSAKYSPKRDRHRACESLGEKEEKNSALLIKRNKVSCGLGRCE